MLKKQTVIYLVCLLALSLSIGGCAGMKEKRKSPKQLYEEGIKALEGHKALFFFHVTDFEGAESAFREIKSRYSFTTYAPLAELRLADIHFRKEEYNEAISAYEDFIKLHPDHDERSYARHRLGLSYFNQVTTADRDQTATEGALIQFQTLMDPESEYTEEAAGKIETCKNTLMVDSPCILAFIVLANKIAVCKLSPHDMLSIPCPHQESARDYFCFFYIIVC